MTAPDLDALIWAIATYQAPLRDLQIHGLALFMILGVSLRMLPAIYGLPRVPERRAWWVLGLLTAAVAGETIVFLVYRWTGNHLIASGLVPIWAIMTAAVLMIALPWRLWRPMPEPDRTAKFVRAAYAWLPVSLVMLLMMPLYNHLAGVSFSHAYFGATRHAITVGFISLMIMGMAARVVPTLNGVDPLTLSNLRGPFLLLNLGCFLRVTMQVATDWTHYAYAPIGLSGVLEVTRLAWWGLGLAVVMRRGRLAAFGGGSPSRTRTRGDRGQPPSGGRARVVPADGRRFPSSWLHGAEKRGPPPDVGPASHRGPGRRVAWRQPDCAPE